jgi:hypothetical protein
MDEGEFPEIQPKLDRPVNGRGTEQSGEILSSGSQSAATLATFQQGQWALAREIRNLLAQGATPQQLQAWHQQNAAQFQAQQQLAQALSLPAALQPMRQRQWVNIPPGASASLQAFLQTQAALTNARVQIHNQLLQSLPPGATPGQVAAMRRQEEQIFHQQHAADLQLQAQRAAVLAAASASQPMRVPGQPMIPPNATPQMQAFIIARTALVQEQANLWNQHLAADPAVRQAAIQQWQQQNAGQFQRLAALAQALANPPVNTQGQNQ